MARFRAHRHDGTVASSSFTPRGNVSGPLVVPAAILLNRLETESIRISAQLTQPGLDARLDLHRLGLSPAGKQEAVPDPRRPVVRGIAETTQPDRDWPLWPRQDSSPVDPVIGVLMVDHGLFPQLADLRILVFRSIAWVILIEDIVIVDERVCCIRKELEKKLLDLGVEHAFHLCRVIKIRALGLEVRQR